MWLVYGVRCVICPRAVSALHMDLGEIAETLFMDPLRTEELAWNKITMFQATFGTLVRLIGPTRDMNFV